MVVRLFGALDLRLDDFEERLVKTRPRRVVAHRGEQTPRQLSRDATAVTNSLLIHGKGKFDCSTPGLKAGLCNATNPECSPYVITVVPGKTYRLRIGSLTSLAALSFEIEGHTMTVVEADGHNVELFVVKNLFIYSGETYSVLIKADQAPTRNYWAVSKVVSRNSTTPNGLAIFNYYPNHPRRSPPTVPPVGPAWNDVAPRLAQGEVMKARQGYILPPPQTSDHIIVMLNTQNRINDYTRWSVNNVSYNLPDTPYLIAMKDRLNHVFDQTPPPDGYDSQNYDIFSIAKNTNATTSSSIYKLQFNSTVDIILQNANTMNDNNTSETHPWHLHGHDFWVMGYGQGKFDINSDPKKYNLVDPIMKNTVSIQPYGWTALRFVADNPGVWAFHCHIEAHFYLGMGVVFEEGVEMLGRYPTSITGCGDTKGYHMDRELIMALFLSLSLLSVPFPAEARIRHFKWEVKYEYKSQDCYKKLAITINGKTPGPTIEARVNDTVVVELKNSLLTENVVIHWHGIRQKGTPWFDGTAGVTQCPIVPGDTFVYKFVVDRPGTYLYHAHYGLQREAGLNGMICVSLPPGESEPYTYDHDRSIILTDWYHKSTYELATGLSSLDFDWVGEPQSLLIHGKGRFCSGLKSDLCDAINSECSPYVITVVPRKTYRLRIGSLTSLAALSFEIEGHNMTVVEADGHNVEPFVVKNLFIYSGETYSVLIKADQAPTRNYWAVSKVVSRKSTTPNGLAIFNYYPNHPRRSPPTVPPIGPAWDDVVPRLAQGEAMKARQGYILPPPQTSDRVIVMLNTQNKINGYTRWSVNNVSYNLPHTPYLIAVKDRMNHVFDQTPPPDGYDSQNYDIFSKAENSNATASSSIYKLQFNSTVDIILQNANTMNIDNNSETHPWHLHGHDFWVLGYGKGKFDINSDPKKYYNLVNPIMKNTVSVQPYGWTALRFVADNPGVWAFHCHIEAHFYLGMGVVFEEGMEMLGRYPTSITGCGDTKGYRMP
ncbi:hypothetical protein RHSIM_Rhsim10G0157300 [Rhododendron simsii]|uniref:L-ascorbate oxidase n=1 Tax=Rhododendron simsii TaxID=118357 RepID=A0A834GD42_RHOSS|nr:hypothetical protein RHSIM_Rhsim10G0157300 [Rhododendron simsii]